MTVYWMVKSVATVGQLTSSSELNYEVQSCKLKTKPVILTAVSVKVQISSFQL